MRWPQLGDVGHIMRGQEHRQISLLVQVPQEVANALFGHHVQPNGGLVEAEDLWIM
jgi:hypothetical protein